MECKKKEAIRAMEIAEKKMQNKDFVGAQSTALKAQQLYPELHNISQMLTLCEVHCAAEQKILHTKMDWYGILQITRTADEASIKKQYRKLALLLHPDKNKFAGAEAAFKLIGEAQRVLTDPQKRNLYDMKCKPSVGSAAHQSATRYFSVRSQPGTWNNSPYTFEQQLARFISNQRGRNYLYPKYLGGLCLFCTMPQCSKISGGVSHCLICGQKRILPYWHPAARAYCSQSASAQQKEVPGQGVEVGSQGTVGNHPGVGTQKTFGTETREQQRFPKTGSTSGVCRDSKSTKKDGNVDMGFGKESKGRHKNHEKPGELKALGNIGKKRQRKFDEESSESFDSGSSTNAVIEEDGVHPARQNLGFTGARYSRRSSRQKNNVTYKEDSSGDDDAFSSPLNR